jgi:hypothetical protein
VTLERVWDAWDDRFSLARVQVSRGTSAADLLGRLRALRPR